MLLVVLAFTVMFVPLHKYWKSLRGSQELLNKPYTTVEFKEEPIVEYNAETVNEAYNHLDELPVVGQVSMPDALGLHLPILEGNTNWNTVVGAATQKPGQVMGKRNYTLGSHRLLNLSTLFGPLAYAEVGQDIWLTNGDAIYQYRCYNVMTISPYNAWVLEDEVAVERGKPVVTLLTCGNAAGTVRHVVQGELVDKWLKKRAPEYAKKAFESDYNWLDSATKWAVYWEVGGDGTDVTGE